MFYYWSTDIQPTVDNQPQPTCDSILCDGEVFAALDVKHYFVLSTLFCFKLFDESEACHGHGMVIHTLKVLNKDLYKSHTDACLLDLMDLHTV